MFSIYVKCKSQTLKFEVLVSDCLYIESNSCEAGSRERGGGEDGKELTIITQSCIMM